MFMTVLFISGIVGFSSNAPAPAVKASEENKEKSTYSIDVEESTIHWKAYKVTGKHNGKIDIRNGQLEFTGASLTGGSFEIDMSSIEVLDLNGGSKEKLENHLRSDDFFSVEKHPVTTFRITRVIPGDADGKYEVTGDLTIKGITKAITFPAEIAESDNGKKATASIKIDRSEFNVRYGSKSFFDNLGDKTIYDAFDLEVMLQIEEAS